MPTCVAGLWKKTRSPGLASAAVTALPACAWSCETRGRLTPNFLYTYCVRPEQAKPGGLSPPQTYLTPRYFLASAINFAAVVPELAAALPLVPEGFSAATTLGSSPRASAAAAASPPVAPVGSPAVAWVVAVASAEEKEAEDRPNRPWIWAMRAWTAATPVGSPPLRPTPEKSLISARRGCSCPRLPAAGEVVHQPLRVLVGLDLLGLA